MQDSHLNTKAVALALVLAGIPTASLAQGDEGEGPPTLKLTGTLRDFRRFDVEHGHADFEQYNTGHRVGIVAPTLDAEGRPVLASSTGQAVKSQYRDAQGRNICPALYDPSKGDVAGSLGSAGAAIKSAQTFAQWYRDVPGVNLAMPHSIVLEWNESSGTYVFHQHDVLGSVAREGLFPAVVVLF
jgi:hypothetical protein